jgi:hypothetical protein
MPTLDELKAQNEKPLTLADVRGKPQVGQGLGVMAAENPFVALSNKVSAGQRLTPKEQSQFTATRNMLLKREKAGDPVAIDILAAARQGRVANMSGLERFGAGVGAGIEQQALGLGQALGLVDRKKVDIAKVGAEPLLNTGAGFAGKLVTDVLPFAAAAKLIQAPAKAGAIVRNVLTPAVQAGGTAALLQPVGTGESKAGQVGTAALFGTGGQLAGAGLGKVYGGRSASVQADPVLRDQLAAAEKAGITLLPRDVISTPFFNKVDTGLSNLPFSGAGKAAARRQAEINLAAGKPIGVTTPYIRPGQGFEAETARSAAGQAYDDFWKGKGIGLDVNDFVSLNTAKSAINKTPIGRKQGRLASQQLDYISQIATTRPLTGGEYQYIRSELKALSGDSASKPYADIALAQLDRMAKKSLSRQELKQLRQIDKRYADVKRVQSVIDASGNVSPGKLSSIVQGTMGKKPKPASAEMRNLAVAGPALANPIPQGIGTAEKLVTYGSALGIGGLGILSPLTATGLAAGFGLNSAARQPIVAQYLMKGAPGVAAKVPLVGPRLAQALPAPATVAGASKTGGAVVGGAMSAKDSKAEMERRRKELIRRQSLLNK